MKLSFSLLIIAAFGILLTFGFADVTTSNAHIKLTDGLTATSSPGDSAWAYFNKDSTMLPAAWPSSPNTSAEFLGTGEFRNPSNISVETNLESLLTQAGSRSYRHTMYWQLFAEPNQTAPYWDWTWYENHTDGQRIRRAINSGQMLDIVLNKVPRWANKCLPIEHPPMGTVIEEQVTLNGTTPSHLSHTLILGEKNEGYDKANVVLVNHATTAIASETLGIGNNSTWQEFSFQHASVVPGSQRVYVNGVLWNEVDFMRGSSTLDKKAYVFFPNTGKIRFGDGWNGAVLANGVTVTASYSYYVNPYREYSGTTYNTTDTLDYRIDYVNGTIRRTANSNIPNGATVKVTYFYLETTWWQRYWQELVNHYGTNVKYYEVWNEENLAQSWPGTIDQYAELLRSAYTNIKSKNASALVVLGGLGFDTDYLSGLYSRNMKNYFDILAWHPYGWQLGPDNPNSQYNVLNNRLFSVASTNGDSTKPVFMNEIGFSTNTQGGMSWADQGTALSRTIMKLKRNPLVLNASWWGPVDEAQTGTLEDDLYFYHLGLMEYDSSHTLQKKPAYYVFKNLGTNKGIIIDLANYDLGGTITQGTYNINKINFSSFGDDISSVLVSYSLNNTTDWQNVSSTISVAASDKNNFQYTVNFSTVTARFVQIQFVKKTNTADFAIDEVKVLTTTGTNAALNKYYSVEGFTSSFSGTTPNLCGNSKQDAGETCQNCPSDVSCASQDCSGGQILCNEICTTPTCTTNTACNDNNTQTTDTCTNPNTCNSYCQNTLTIPTCNQNQILCNNQCTTPTCTTNTTCNDNNTQTTDTCTNPNTCNSYCQNTLTIPTCNQNQILCNNQCTTPTCIADANCNDNNTQTNDSCTNSNTCNAACLYTPITQQQNCPSNKISCNSQCITPSCIADSNCNDNNPQTTDACAGANTCTAACQFTQISTGGTGGTGGGGGTAGGTTPTIACVNNKGCNDNNPCTKDTCQNPGLTSSKCIFTKINKCRALFVSIMSVSVSGGVTKGLDFTAIVTDDSGNPIADANVTYNGLTKATKLSGTVIFTASDKDMVITAKKNEFGDASSTVKVSEEISENLRKNIILSIPNKITATEQFVVIVSDNNGNPVKGASVVYGGEEKISDENGAVTFTASTSAPYVFASFGNTQSRTLLLIQEPVLGYKLNDQDIIYIIAVIIFVILLIIPLIKYYYKSNEREPESIAKKDNKQK